MFGIQYLLIDANELSGECSGTTDENWPSAEAIVGTVSYIKNVPLEIPRCRHPPRPAHVFVAIYAFGLSRLQPSYFVSALIVGTVLLIVVGGDNRDVARDKSLLRGPANIHRPPASPTRIQRVGNDPRRASCSTPPIATVDGAKESLLLDRTKKRKKQPKDHCSCNPHRPY
jgi:hypothetical protein